MDDLPQRLSIAPTTAVTGAWMRHCPGRYASGALAGRTGDGRWGTAGGFPVLYLGSTVDGVIVEAYRHLVDQYLDPQERAVFAAGVRDRVLVHAQVDVDEILDLRTASARMLTGLSMEILTCDPADADGYAACQHVAQVAHQLGLHGVISPSATGFGETLALFTARLSAAEQPERDGDDEIWLHLPPDPRLRGTTNIRIVRQDPH